MLEFHTNFIMIAELYCSRERILNIMIKYRALLNEVNQIFGS